MSVLMFVEHVFKVKEKCILCAVIIVLHSLSIFVLEWCRAPCKLSPLPFCIGRFCEAGLHE